MRQHKNTETHCVEAKQSIGGNLPGCWMIGGGMFTMGCLGPGPKAPGVRHRRRNGVSEFAKNQIMNHQDPRAPPSLDGALYTMVVAVCTGIF
jgi:hypothetical protein